MNPSTTHLSMDSRRRPRQDEICTQTNALVRLQIRQAMANVNADFLRAELIPSPTVALYHVDVATDPRFPTSALFYADSPLVERNRDGGPASSGAPALASPTTFPADADLEYRFWIDERPDQGIADANQMGVRPPTGTQFPVCLTVDVWSDNLDFSIRSAHITLNQTGNSDTASFRFRLKDVAREAEILTFVAHENRVLAVFRVAFVFDGDFVNRRLYVSSSHQEHILACTDWSIFPHGTPSASAITLYMREHDSRLQIFSREAPYQVWRQLGTSATEFERRSGFIYLEFQRIALEHAGNKCDIPSRRRRLAQFGQDLLSAFATGGTGTGARDILGVLQAAPHGTEVTVLTDRSCANLVIPWGIMTHEPPSSSRRKDFWASRFSLCVQPPFHRPRRHAKQPGDGVSIALAYEERPECDALRNELEKLGLKSTPIEPSTGKPLAVLETTHFDIVHFFCHGHAAPDLNQAERSLIDVLSDPQKELTTDLRWKLMQGDLGTYLRWGQRTTLLSDLTLNGPSHFAGAPIVILTACESGVPFAGSIGFVSYFLETGACAVVATEGPVPWEASRDFAHQLVTALVKGEPVARAALNARNSLLGNTELFGLAYSVFGNGQAFVVS